MIGRKSLPTALAALCLCAGGARAEPVVFHVTLPSGGDKPISGRLLLFAEPVASAKGGAFTSVDSGFTHPRETAIAAQEVTSAAPGAIVEVDADIRAYPSAFSKLPPGAYAVQAVLDVNHHYAYGGREPGDLVSPVTELNLPAGGALTLTETIPPPADPWTPPAGAATDVSAGFAATRADTQPIDFVSPALSRFWGGRSTCAAGW